MPTFHPASNPALHAAIDTSIERLMPCFAVQKAIPSGGRAHGDVRPDSDTDMAIILHRERHPTMQTKLAMTDIAFDAVLNSGVLIQPLPIWDVDRRDPNHWPNPELLRNIEHMGIGLWPTP